LISNFVPPANFDFNARKGDNVAQCFWNMMNIMVNMADNITFRTKTPGIIQMEEIIIRLSKFIPDFYITTFDTQLANF